MLISCDCSCYDGESPQLYVARLIRARKQHRCVECYRTIEPGEQYENVRGLWDSVWKTYKTCLGCYRIREHLCSSGWIFGQVASIVADCVGFNYVTDEDSDG